MISRTVFFFTLLVWSVTVMGQSRLRGHLKNFYPTDISMLLPEAGAYMPQKPLRIPVDDDGFFDIALNTTGSGFVSFYHYGDAREVRFWISPGSDDEITFDWEDPVASFEFSGTHKAINHYLNSPQHLRTHLPEEEPWVKALLQASKSPAMREAAIKSLQQQERTRLEQLNQRNLIDPTFYQLAQKETHFFWTYLLSSSPFRGGVRRTEGSVPFRGGVHGTEGYAPFRGGVHRTEGSSASSTSTRKTEGQNEALQHDGTRTEGLSDASAIKSRYYFLYLQAYFEQRYPEADHVARLAQAATELEEPVLRAFKANYLYNHADYGDRHYALVPALAQYKNTYPQDVSTELLTIKINPIEDKYEMAREPITAEMEIVADLNQYTSLEELIAQYKGEVLYFDIWATWCKPCILEFQMRHARPLKSFIKGKPVRIIYLSVDADASHAQWMKAVKKYKLNGLNVHVPDNKATALREFLGNGSHPLFAIPRYFIVDKAGNVVNKEAPRPSDGATLYAELAKYF